MSNEDWFCYYCLWGQGVRYDKLNYQLDLIGDGSIDANLVWASPVGSYLATSCSHSLGLFFCRNLTALFAADLCLSEHLAQDVFKASGSNSGNSNKYKPKLREYHIHQECWPPTPPLDCLKPPSAFTMQSMLDFLVQSVAKEIHFMKYDKCFLT